MEEKDMRELNAEEMSKVSGGADTSQECVVHVWMDMGPGSEGEIYQCRICGKIEIRIEKKDELFRGLGPIPEKLDPKPDPAPVPLN